MRAPVGGLFRHVRDLARAQAAAGHAVGVVCDAVSADALTEGRLQELRDDLALGLVRVPMTRDIGIADFAAHRAITRTLMTARADIVHGHGAKGGAYARLAARTLKRQRHRIRAFYTPHGGSLHYAPTSAIGRVYMALERSLVPHTDGLIFESRFSADRFAAQVGRNPSATRVIPNGLLQEEFALQVSADDASDVLFVGELRTLKGVDVLLDALALVKRDRPVTATIVGDGPDADAFKRQSVALGLSASVSFPGAMPARSAFTRGRLLVVPSRAESFPYIVLEASAACMPMIATKVGGIPEIVEGSAVDLLPAGDAQALALAIGAAMSHPEQANARAAQLRNLVAERFTVARMARSIEEFYLEAGQDSLSRTGVGANA